jgi:hypothetical protein
MFSFRILPAAAIGILPAAAIVCELAVNLLWIASIGFVLFKLLKLALSLA